MANRFNIDNFANKNALIAVFDGLEYFINGSIGNEKDDVFFEVPNYYPFCKMNDDENTGSITIGPDDLQYHERWDWLMPVVEKIRNLKVNTYTMSDATEWANLIQSLNKSLQHVYFIRVYEAIYGIINFYNKKNESR